MKKILIAYAIIMTVAINFLIWHIRQVNKAKANKPAGVLAYTIYYSNDSMHVYEGSWNKWIGSYKWVKGENKAADCILNIENEIND